MIAYILAGFIGVSNMILRGVYGDLLVEKFVVLKVYRSVIVGIFWSMFLFSISPHLPLFVVALVVISLERITTEIYKALMRREKQDKYQIPSDLGITAHHRLKFVFGVLLLVLLGGGVYYGEVPFDNIYITLLVGFGIAFGGMVKDAPYEGFDTIKFFRSPLVALIVGFGITLLFPSLGGKYFLLSVAGGERIFSEFYKKIFKGRSPGKFKQTCENQVWRKERKKLLIIYAFDIGALIMLFFI